MQCRFHGLSCDWTSQAQGSFSVGGQLSRQWRNSDYGEDGVVSGPYRVYADEWSSAYRNGCRGDQNRAVHLGRYQYSPGRCSRRHQSLVLQADTCARSVRGDSQVRIRGALMPGRRIRLELRKVAALIALLQIED